METLGMLIYYGLQVAVVLFIIALLLMGRNYL